MAVYKAVKRLQQKPNHAKASKVLQEAYTLAVNEHMSAIEYLDKSNDAYKYDKMVEEYKQVRRLNTAIFRYPKYQNLVTLVNVDDEISFTEKEASRVHYSEAISLMNKGTKAHARDAYYHFGRASYFTPDQINIYDKMDEALEMGMVNVAVEFASDRNFFRNYRTEAMYNNLYTGISRMNYRFMRVVDAQDNRFPVDEILQIEMEDAFVGGVNVSKNVRTVTRDDVYMGEAVTDSGEVVKVYGTVSADYIEFKKTINSNSSILVQRVDGQTLDVIRRRIIPNSYCWTDTWATYRGDKRALSDAQYQRARKTEPSRPNPQWLFAQASTPLIGQACDYVGREFSYLR
jgi:hypothetical protein